VQVPLCRVEGTIEGNIGFELWLPLASAWNHRLLGAGVGGDAGVFNYTDLGRRVTEGFAAVTTDSGHKVTNTRWMADPKARQDYEHRATHLATLAAKALVTRFYAKPADHAYFLGCSGGGRQGLKELELYPQDYDGIVAGAPGPYMPLISVRMMYFSLLQKQNPAGALSDADWSLYEKATFDACDGKDGVKDGVVENPLTCHFKPTALLCKPGETQNCLTPAKLAMLTAIIGPMPDEHGRPMDKGLLPACAPVRGRPRPCCARCGPTASTTTPIGTKPTSSAPAIWPRRIPPCPNCAPTAQRSPLYRARRQGDHLSGLAGPSVIAGPTIDFYRKLAAAQGGAQNWPRPCG
jgi:feruloyl esterase